MSDTDAYDGDAKIRGAGYRKRATRREWSDTSLGTESDMIDKMLEMALFGWDRIFNPGLCGSLIALL
jgi:hypothetical protein